MFLSVLVGWCKSGCVWLVLYVIVGGDVAMWRQTKGEKRGAFKGSVTANLRHA